MTISGKKYYKSPIWYLHQNNADPSRFLHIYTRKVSPPHSKHYYQHPIYFPLCNTDFRSVRFKLYEFLRDYIFTSYHTKHLSPTTPQTDARTRRRHSRLPLNINIQNTDVMTASAASCIDSDLKSRTDLIQRRGGDHIYTKCHIATHSHLCIHTQYNIYMYHIIVVDYVLVK